MQHLTALSFDRDRHEISLNANGTAILLTNGDELIWNGELYRLIDTTPEFENDRYVLRAIGNLRTDDNGQEIANRAMAILTLHGENESYLIDQDSFREHFVLAV